MAAQRDFTVEIGSSQFDPLVEQDRSQQDDEPVADPDEVRSWIVQFHDPLTHDDISDLRRIFGLSLSEFVPNFSYLERLSSVTVHELRTDRRVRAVTPLTGRMKLSPQARQARADDNAFGEFIALLFRGADPDAIRDSLVGLGAVGLTVLDSRDVGGPVSIRFALPLARLEDASLIDEIRWIELAPEIADDDVLTPGLHAGTAGSIAGVWKLGLHGEGQIVGILDNGPPSLTHCFFIDTENNTPAPRHRKVVAVRNARRQPAGRHATFVAGCVAGDDVNHPGAAANRGGAWAAKLVVGNRKDLEVFNPTQSKATTMLQELTAAARAGAVIHTNSWHAAPPNGSRERARYDLISRDVDEFSWIAEDHLVLGSSGNTGEEQGPPGTAKNAVCVSAAFAEAADPRLGDGNPGPTADGRRKPDVVAVGCGVKSAIFDTDCGTGPHSPCASSYATPLTAASAALIRQYFMDGWYPSRIPSPDQSIAPSGALVKAVLVDSSTNSSQDVNYPNDVKGWGLVQVDRSLLSEGVTRRMRIWDVRHAGGLMTGGSSSHQIWVDGDEEQLKATLAWTDPPAAMGAANPVVNSLHLLVVSPDGMTLLGNVFNNGTSAPGGAPDLRNNVQVVLVDRPQVGEWTVMVNAPAVNVGRPGQGFALVVTGAIATEPH